MKISIAQTRPVKADIASNMEKHKQLIALAVSFGADCIFFPELSLTGYEPELAKGLAISQDDKLLDGFQVICDLNNITIGIGVPTRSDVGTRVSMVIFQPNEARQTYSKQQLHSDEYPYFVSGDTQVILNVANKMIAPAICYESLQPIHSEGASDLGAEIYIASVAKSQDRVDDGMVYYPLVAKRFSMPVLMANCLGYCGNFKSVGKSSVWSKQGDLVGQLDNRLEGVLIFDTETEEVVLQYLQ